MLVEAIGKGEINEKVKILFCWLVSVFDETEKNPYFKTKEGKLQEKMKKKGNKKNKRDKNFIIL